MKNITTIYYSGNILLEEDNLPFKIVPQLEELFPDINFIHHDPNENLPDKDRDIVIIDTVINTDKVVTISNPNQLIAGNIYTPHDWDLAFNLKLLLELKVIDKFLIIGVPPQGNLKIIIKDIQNIIYSQLMRKK